MAPDPDYPRWMFHRSLAAVIVHSAEEEALLGTEWSRTIPPRAVKSAEAESRPPAKPKQARRALEE